MANMTATIGRPPVIVHFGENTAEAIRQAAISNAAATAAEISAAYAESMTGPTYADTSAGLAATTDGQGFAVDNGDGTVTVYQNDSGSAVEQRTLATTAALAAPDGSEKMGTRQTGANKRPRTARDKANDTLTLADVEGVDMDGVEDSSTGFTNAVADGRQLVFPNGVLKIDTDLVLSPSQLSLIGTGENSVLDFSGGGSLTIKSDLVALPNLSADIQGGEGVATFASAHGLSVGDCWLVYNPTNKSFSSYRDYYRDGRMFRVLEVISSTSVRIFGVSPRTFASADVQCYKIDGGPITLRDFRIIPQASAIPGILIDGHHTIEIDGVTIDRGSEHSGISIYRCYDVDIWFVKALVDYDATETGYPVSVANTQNFRIHGGSLSSVRHAIALGSGDDIGCVPTADGIIHDMMLQSRGDYQAVAADMHGNCENVQYHNCIMQNGAGMGGRDAALIGCTIYGVAPSGTSSGFCVYGTEVGGGTYRLIDNVLVTWGDGTTHGIVNLDVSGRTEDFEMIARGNRLENRSGATTIRAYRIALGSTAGSYRVDTVIDGFANKGASPAQVLMLAGTADISAISRHVIQNLSGCDAATLIGASASANYAAPMRLPRTGGSTTLTATSGTNQTVSGNITLKYTYPRVPRSFATVTGDRSAQGSVFACTASTIRPMVAFNGTSTWGATADYPVSWSVAIEDF